MRHRRDRRRAQPHGRRGIFAAASASLTSQPYVLVAGKPAGMTAVGEPIAAATAKPNELKFASTGAGSGKSWPRIFGQVDKWNDCYIFTQ